MTRAFAFLFLLTVTCLHSQPQGTATLLSVNDGLSQGMVFNLLEGRDGFVWIATKDGLNRYDGYRFEVFSPNAFDPFSVAAGEIRTLHEDPRGWLWLCYNGGIDFFFPETGRSCHLPLSAGPNFNGYVHSFALLPGGTMWLECKGMLWKIEAAPDILQKAMADGQAFPDIKYTVLDSPPDGVPADFRFTSVFFTKNKTLLAASTNGIYRIEQQAGNYRLIPEALPGRSVYFIGQDKSGWLWLHSDDALWVRKSSTAPFEQAHTTHHPNWKIDREGYLWNLRDGTLQKWLPANLAAGGSPSFEVPVMGASKVNQTYYFTDLEIDRSGNAWVGTSGFGLVKINLAKPKFTSRLPLTSQQMIYEDPAGDIFTVREPGVMFPARQFDRSRPNPLLEKLPPGKEILAVAFDKKGNGWVKCTDRELYRIDASTKEPFLFKTTGYGLLVTSNGKVLNVSANALHSLDPETGREAAYPFGKGLTFNYDTGARNHFFYEDSSGNIWIYAFEGLLKAKPTDGGYRFEHLKNDPASRSSLSNNYVLSVAEDPLEPGRYLWVGTKGSGLNRLDLATGTFKHFTTENGLPDNVVYGILAENTPLKEGREAWIWLSTNKGLCRFNVREETVKNFTAADGLQSNEFNTSSYMKTRDGTMIFGGVNGLTVFHPDSLRFNQRKPRTVLTRLWVNNQPVSFRQGTASGRAGIFLEKNGSQDYRLDLRHDQNVVAIEFAALEFSNPSQNQYRYQLLRRHTFGPNEGEDWVELGTRNSIQFANLQPGSYTFSVLGSNNDGIFGEQVAVLEFTIHPPWWVSWWAYLLYALALAATIRSMYRYQLRRKLEHEETLRLKELDEFKNRFFTNITHEFRTPLTVILGMTERLESEGVASDEGVTPVYPLTSRPGILIKRNAENLLRLINQILDLAKLESNTLKLNYVQGDVLPYLRYIAESLHSLANTQNVMLRVESSESTIVMDYDPERLLQIVYNLLSNAIKFTPSGGRVVLRAVVNHGDFKNHHDLKTFVLTVTDTGAGIPPEDLPHIFDRFFQAGNSPVSASSANRAAGGTGIGLALTRELVKAMGGEISVESEVGKGSRFEVVLPVSNKAILADLAPPPPLTPKGEPQSPYPAEIFKKITPELPVADSTSTGAERPGHEGNPSILPSPNPSILLIEDNPDVVEYLASCLGENYQLDFAYNGRAGIEKALETVPDLIVSDVMMPEKDGFEVCETLKNDERTSHIPIVLLTAKAGLESRIAGLRRGADAYLAKPFHREELLVILANLLELRKKLQLKYSESAVFSLQSSVRSPQSAVTEVEEAFILKVKTAIQEHLSDSNFTVEKLGRSLALSQRQLHRKLTALTGQNAAHLIRSMRLARAKEMLMMKEKNVSEVAWEVGFDDPKYFSRIFTEEFGVPPSKV